MQRFVIVVLALSAYRGWHWWTTERAVDRPPGIVAPDEPLKVTLDEPSRFELKGYTVIKRAKYDITARLLRKEIYRLDGGAEPGRILATVRASCSGSRRSPSTEPGKHVNARRTSRVGCKAAPSEA